MTDLLIVTLSAVVPVQNVPAWLSHIASMKVLGVVGTTAPPGISTAAHEPLHRHVDIEVFFG